MLEITFTEQSCQSALSIIADIITPLVSALIGGAIAFAGIYWQERRNRLNNEKNKREQIAKEISQSITNLQIITVNNINILSNKDPDDAVQEIDLALEDALTKINQYAYCISDDIMAKAQVFFEKTRRNIERWQNKDKTSTAGQAPLRLLPHQDQGNPEGEACQAYGQLELSLKYYVNSASKDR